MGRARSRPLLAFTLVELLVVIGIIAVLIGVLLPVLSGVAARGRDLQCQSNIRQCVQLILAYASENDGRLPYGRYFVRGGAAPDGWGAGPGGEFQKYEVTLWSVVSRMSSRSHNIEDPNFVGTEARQDEAARNAAPVLRCPEAMLAFPHLASYAGNFAAFASPFWDAEETGAARDGPPWRRLIEDQTRTAKCFPFTALVWDTAVTPGMASRIGHVVGGDIDGQRVWLGAVHPQYRFLSIHDPFARFPPGTHGNNRPVQMSLAQFTRWLNNDPSSGLEYGIAWYPYQGNLRFRHNRDTTCNVGFADGHVGKFTGKFKRDGSVISHDALRKHFLLKWPSGTGIAPDPSLPH
jgi:prepilin-type processing-associated H-X9-DG protein